MSQRVDVGALVVVAVVPVTCCSESGRGGVGGAVGGGVGGGML